MEFVAQLARGERLVRWHRKRRPPGPARPALRPGLGLRAPPAHPERAAARSRSSRSMPVDGPRRASRSPPNDFAWTRARFGPPRITRGADLVGTSLVETGVVDPDRYLEAVAALAKTHGATRYFAHRRESAEKLRRLAARDGPGDRPPGPAPGADRPPRPDRPHDPELPLHGGPHPAAGPGRHRGQGRGLRHRPRRWLTERRLTARAGLPVGGHRTAPGTSSGRLVPRRGRRHPAPMS